VPGRRVDLERWQEEEEQMLVPRRNRSRATSWPSREDEDRGHRHRRRVLCRHLARHLPARSVADEVVLVLLVLVGLLLVLAVVAQEEDQDLPQLLLELELEPSPSVPATTPVPPRHPADPRSSRPRPRQPQLP